MKIKFAILAVLFLTFSSVNAQAKMVVKHNTKENNAIPPEFGEDKNTILICIIEGKNSYDKYMIKNIEEFYVGKYEFVLIEDLDNEAYADKEVYRYVLDREKLSKAGISNIGSYGGGPSSVGGYSIITSKFFIYDRKEDKDYQSRVTSSSFASIIKGYAKALSLLLDT